VQQDAAGVAKTKVRVILALLTEWKIVKSRRVAAPAGSRRSGAGYSLRQSDLSEADLQQIAEFYDARVAHDRDKLDRMIVYAQTALCRWKTLVDYFEESVDWTGCGNCDNCSKSADRLG
jgi:ATP-dependent DNA helicase RecQ